LIIRTWLEMPVGQHFILVNGHDPVPLYHQFSAEWPGTFTWEHVAKGQEEVRLSRNDSVERVSTVWRAWVYAKNTGSTASTGGAPNGALEH
jgi:uncharacterized protein (DUF2249 family)